MEEIMKNFIQASEACIQIIKIAMEGQEAHLHDFESQIKHFDEKIFGEGTIHEEQEVAVSFIIDTEVEVEYKQVGEE